MTCEKAAEITGQSWQAARYKLEGLVFQGKLIRDEYSAAGEKQPQPRHRYGLKEDDGS